jgi:hypothetical protein
MIFQKGDRAIISGQEYSCIVADEEYAVLGEIHNESTSFENTRIYSNLNEFRDQVIGLERIN